MTRHYPLSVSIPAHQSGVALLTALIFLVVLTFLGIGVFATTTSEEKMARNFRDKEIALHAAEAALNEAKILITGSFASGGTRRYPLSEQSCVSGTSITGFKCPMDINSSNFLGSGSSKRINSANIDLFSGPDTGAPLNQVGTDSPAITGVISQPRYLVIWQDPKVCGPSNTGECFLIIAQGRGRLTNTRVNLVELFTY